MRIDNRGLRIVLVFAVLLTVAGLRSPVSSAQTPGAYLSASAKINFAEQYKQPGVGGVISGGFVVPSLWSRPAQRLYLTEDIELTKERKAFLHDGHTIASVTGLQYHFDNGWFARTAFSIAQHSNEAYTKTATRFHFGGGYSYYARGHHPGDGWLPLVTATAVGFVPIGDPNSGRGVKVSADGFLPIGTWWGIHAKAAAATASFTDSFGRRARANYGEFQLGGFINLSAILGS